MSLDRSADALAGVPAGSMDDLVAWLRAGERPRERWRVGMEHEKCGMLAGSLLPVPYEGARGIEALFARLAAGGFSQHLERGRAVALVRGAATVSLEPGGQVELSGAPAGSAVALRDELLAHLAEVKAASSELGHVWLGCGYRPWGTVAEQPWVPKGRYAVMREHLAAQGRLALDMMLMTQGVQASFDWSDEADFAAKLRAGQALGALVAALYANSPIVKGEPSGLLDYRYRVWREVDAARCGLVEAVFAPDFSYRAWASFAADVPMIFVRRGDRYTPAGGLTFRCFMAEGLHGERATLADWADHLTTIFTEARAKHVIEVRSADAGDVVTTAAFPALWKALLYDAGARAAAESLLADLSFAERVSLQDDVARRALQAEARGRRVLDLVRELVRIAAASPALDPAERALLAPLEERAGRGTAPAEDALAALERGGREALVNHWRY
jgi:glutamate--cysteine ligase